jgi:uncharacterized membrane-anchored protein
MKKGMNTKQKVVIIGGFVIVLVFFIASVVQKEILLRKGKTVYLALAPVDPRSLMQGDYMVLNYEHSRHLLPENLGKRAYCVLKTDNKGVGTFVRYQKKVQPLNPNEVAILCYRNASEGISIGAESYFFEEGKAQAFEQAKYGVLKVDAKGKQVLVGLANDSFELLPLPLATPKGE